MANGRFLSKTIAVSVQLAGVSDPAENLFFRMIPHLDSDGRLEGDPRLVKAIAAPLKESFTVDRVTALLHELAGATDAEGEPLIRWYTAKGKMVLQFPGFGRHQKGLRKDKEAASRLPTFDESATVVPLPEPPPPPPKPEPVRDDNGGGPELGRSRYGVRRGKGREGEGEGEVQGEGEGKGEGKGAADAAATPTSNSFQAGPYIADWREIRKGTPPGGVIARYLKIVETEVGPVETRHRWRRFLQARQHSPPAYFAQEHGQYAEPEAPEIRWMDEERTAEAIRVRH